MATLTTVPCSMPGDSYRLFERPPREFTVHLAGPGEHGGTGPCICGFDRFARKDGHYVVGFSVGGGFSGPGFIQRACAECARLVGDATIRGMHAALFETQVRRG